MAPDSDAIGVRLRQPRARNGAGAAMWLEVQAPSYRNGALPAETPASTPLSRNEVRATWKRGHQKEMSGDPVNERAGQVLPRGCPRG